MISKTLSQVKSPFSDELINGLVRTFISTGCDDRKFYRAINQLEPGGESEDKINSDTQELLSAIYNYGVGRYDLDDEATENSRIIYDSNDYWLELYSSKNPLNKDAFTPDKKRPLIYRIFLNLKGKEKADFIRGYLKSCKEKGIPYELKFSKYENRKDQIVILSRIEDFESNLSIVEGLSQGLHLGKLPTLIGEYKQGIGVAEEYHNRLLGSTKSRLLLLRVDKKKYLCDHKDEFYDQLSDQEKATIDFYSMWFNRKYERAKEDMEIRKSSVDIQKEYYQQLSTMDCAKENIDNVADAYRNPNELAKLGQAIQKIYSSNPEQFINEVTNNYRKIGTSVWGLSENLLFTNETENRFLKAQDQDDDFEI